MFMAQSKLTGNWLIYRGKPPYHSPSQIGASLFESETKIEQFLNQVLQLSKDTHEIYKANLIKVEAP